jgi:malonyl CoA-acyl carrier protein transacylase
VSRPVAVLFCPGRGSYGRGELGFLRRTLAPGRVAEALAAADAARAVAGRPTVSELDGADSFRPGLHLDGENAAELIYFSTLADAERLREEFDVVAVAGNSLGWYTALAAADCLSPEHGWRLVAAMSRLQKGTAGGQLLTTTVGEDWRPRADLVGAVDEALATTAGLGPDRFVARSIRLGGHEVLAGTEAGVAQLLEVLPRVESKERAFPFRLAGHGPFHTALCADVAERALQECAGLPAGMPAVPLIDGRGDIHTPWSADPRALLHYTLTAQVTTTFDFTASVRTALREFQPDVLLCPGPGTSLRAPIGHVVLREGYRGIGDKAALFASDLVRIGSRAPA